MACEDHPGREARQRCHICHKPLCSECSYSPKFLGGMVLCAQCLHTVASRVERELGKQKSGMLPQTTASNVLVCLVGSCVLLAFAFLIPYFVTNLDVLLYVGLAFAGVGIVSLIPGWVLVHVLNQQRERRLHNEEPLGRVNMMGWSLLCLGAMYGVFGVPAIGEVFDLGLLFILPSLVLSFVAVLGGFLLATR